MDTVTRRRVRDRGDRGAVAVLLRDPRCIQSTNWSTFLEMMERAARRWLAGWLAAGWTVHALGGELVTTGSVWRWLPGTNEASTPVAAWRGQGFSDSRFTSAPAPFWYGDVLPGGTQLSGMQSVYSCIFLRRTFGLTNTSAIGGLRMTARVDDGFVAWINGAEVLRVNMPGEPGTAVSVGTLAENALEPVAFATYDLPDPRGYLVAGTNVLAVQVFQSSLGSSDLGFDASLESIVTETIPPRLVEIAPPPGAVTSLSQVTVRFSEPVTGVAAAHLLVNGVGARDVNARDSTTYDFSFAQPPYGAVDLRWSGNHNIRDLALPPNRFDASAPEASWSYQLVDRTPPVVAIVTPAAASLVRSLTNLTVLFSEPVTGVDASDLLIHDVPAASAIAVAPSQYHFTFPEPQAGTVRFAWKTGHAIADTGDPPNAFGGGTWTCRLDPNAPEARPYLSEFMASNTRGLRDEDGDFSDWIEIYNPGATTVSLDGWQLTDNPDQPAKWRFPATNLAGGTFLVVFASAKDRRLPGARLHTNFQLSAGGEYLALVPPDPALYLSEYSPAYPRQVPDVSYGFAQSGEPPEYATSAVPLYFTAPTPGSSNLGGAAVPGPVIAEVTHAPNVPLDGDEVVVTARVLPAFRAVDGVALRYRIMFGTEIETAMYDDGAHQDGLAGDGVFGASIPASLSNPGEMIRYLVAARDVEGQASKWPLFTQPTSTEQYLGTVVAPGHVTSKLPVFHLFVAPEQIARIDTESGGRIAFFYDGEFYDNVYMELRGNTSAGLAKKAHRLEFNRGHELRHAGPGGRTRRSSLLGEYLDPAYMRQHLCFWLLNRIGVPAPFDYPVRVQMNGAFYQLAFHSDVIGAEQMERLGYDPNGALYKAVGNLVPSFASTGVFQKLEPEDDPSRTDYLQLANGISETAPIATRRAAVFDLLDLPQVINHLAGSRWCAENDDVWANMSLYRDTWGDGLWRCIPFDMNASWGQLYGGSSPLEATNDNSKSHPLYGGSSTGGNYNRLYDVIVSLPETRQMLLRRQRSILDQLVKPPGTPAAELVLENYILSISNLISAEAALDRSRWGFSPWAPGKTFAQGVSDLVQQFVVPRRRHWYVTHSLTNTSRPIGIRNNSNAGIPLSQPPGLPLTLVDVDFNPPGGNQEQEFLCLSNTAPYAVDLSGWSLGGAVSFECKPGTVMPGNSVAYVSPNPRAFRARTSGPRGGQGLFVLGPYRGQLSARGETLTVSDPAGQAHASFSYPGAPSLAQRFLRITEIMYHPADLAGSPIPADDYEYLELRNLSPTATLDLSGVRLVNGVEFSFAGSAVTRLEPGARVLVVRNPTALAARYGPGLPVAGAFTGNLDNGGERLQLLDASNEEILDFEYDDDWHPLTDGYGFSLIVVREDADPEAWSDRAQWRSSGAISGTPGSAAEPQPYLAPILVHEALTRPEGASPRDTIELYNPTDEPVDLGGWWLSDDLSTPAKFSIPRGTIVAAHGYVTFDETQFNQGAKAFGLGADGDEIWLFSGDPDGNLTGYVHGHRFGAAEEGVSFGRQVTSDGKGHFVAQVATSLGRANVGPQVGPVVINELRYKPSPHPDPGQIAGEDFIELVNASPHAVALSDPLAPSEAWRIRGGLSFDFPPGSNLAAGEHALLVGFDPVDTAAAAGFRTKYGVPAGIRLFGPWLGGLDRGGDVVELQKPTSLAEDAIAYVVVDLVNFRDEAPWPRGPEDTEWSLQRREPLAFGNDPAHWVAAPPTAGTPNTADLDADGMADWWENEFFGSPGAIPTADLDGDAFSNHEEYVAGTDPADPASFLCITALTPPPGAAVSFETAPGHSYTVLFTDDLGKSPWTKLADVPASGLRQVVTIADPGHATHRVYRLMTPPRP